MLDTCYSRTHLHRKDLIRSDKSRPKIVDIQTETITVLEGNLIKAVINVPVQMMSVQQVDPIISWIVKFSLKINSEIFCAPATYFN